MKALRSPAKNHLTAPIRIGEDFLNRHQSRLANAITKLTANLILIREISHIDII